MFPLILRTKYAFHSLLWLLDPDLILDVGSMDGSDSKKFKQLVPSAEVVAFEGNPNNYRVMCADIDLQKSGVRVINRLVSNQEGSQSFFVQKSLHPVVGFNKGTSSAMRRDELGMETEEVRLDAVRIDSFLAREYPNKKRVAMWIDVEGHAYQVLEGLREAQDCVYLIHVEVETREIWPGQKVESEIIALAKSMGFIPVARGAHSVQHDLIFIKETWYSANRRKISAVLHIAKWFGPIFAKILRTRGQA